jgi:hypothetical protein
MNLVFKAARDFITPEVDRVLIDSAEDFEKVRDFMRLLGPQYVDRIEYYNNGRSLFKDFKVDEEVRKLLRPNIKLPSGGSIVIETTEALTVIDVNSGKFTGGKNLEDTIVKTNIEAAAEIARQVRLRDIGGIIVCDFIDMSTENARNRVIATLEAGLRKDRTRSTIQSFSALGLLEFTRKRVGKDLSQQLRGACPTCTGIGTVMSPESVAIEAFRDVRMLGHTHSNGEAKMPIEVVSAPTVGAQIEYWYEDELAKLEKELEVTIAVRVDAAIHPEKVRVERMTTAEAATAPPPNIRVGDEIEVDLVHARLPIPTSALAIVGDRLVEVENAANAVGETIKIKIIDIDDDGNILAEPRAPISAAKDGKDGFVFQTSGTGDAKKRRRRGGRGRKKELTAAEQDEQLRELAEEAAKGLGARPALGISTASEAEAEDIETREAAAHVRPLATVTPLHAVPDYAAVDPSGEGRAFASYGGGKTGEPQAAGDGTGRRRRRRRRRRGGAGEGAPGAAALAGNAGAPASIEADDADGEGFEDDDMAEGASTAEGAPAVAGTPGTFVGEDGVVRKRRRRRRRRGRGGAGVNADTLTGTGGTTTAIPDRQIFRVDGNGAAEPTGETAPPEPNRSIARVDRRPGAVAIDAPPKSLRIAEETPQVAVPARRRGRPPKAAAALELSAPPPQAALPGSTAAEAPKKRGRPRKEAVVAAEAAPVEAAAPKKRGRPPKVATAEVTVAGTGAEKPATATRKKTAKKATAAAPVALKSSAKKSPAAKKTTTRKKSS